MKENVYAMAGSGRGLVRAKSVDIYSMRMVFGCKSTR